MANALTYPNFLAEIGSFTLASDFPLLVTGHDGWTTFVVDGGTSVTVGDARGGIVALATGATDNNEAMLRSTNRLFLPTASRPLEGRVRLNFTEANTDDGNLFFGFASSAGANLLVDDGGGPRTSGSIFGIYKVDGGTVWRCITRNGSDATDTISLTPAGAAAGVYDDLQIFVVEYSGTQCEVTFKVNTHYLRDANGIPITHRVNYASLTEMNFVPCYIKAGGAVSEVPNVDWACAGQTR